ITDGVIPSNEGRGYVLRRILRRAARYGRQYLKIDGPFIVELVPTVVELMGGALCEIVEREQYVTETILAEEESFGRTLDRGIKTWFLFATSALIEQVKHEQASKSRRDKIEMTCMYRPVLSAGSTPPAMASLAGFVIDVERGGQGIEQIKVSEIDAKTVGRYTTMSPAISGKDVFELYATYGFPADLTHLMAGERGMTVDITGFEAAMEQHRRISGAGEAFRAAEQIEGLPATDDKAKYAAEPIEAAVLGWVIADKYATSGSLPAGSEASVVLDRTNLYGEQGGQVGDTGVLTFDGGRFIVGDSIVVGSTVLHIGAVEGGELTVGQTVTATVGEHRIDTMRNHTATHLLNWALRQVLGEHVNQAGSVVAPDRLRFDFTHNQAVTGAQLTEVERLANTRILADDPVSETILPLSDARKIPGVRAVFGEKYPDPVRVISIGTEDPVKDPHRACAIEFCGGTHLERTSQIGLLKILTEESV
ncbi:MAG: hypothetical protein KAX78_02925, partial [Phycisphaerae bacterium]|nr:hypothetical protein [Phycisphaerae bacterium]